jgi:hypothetical protein
MLASRVGTISDPPLQESVTDPQTLLDALAETEDETFPVECDVEVFTFLLVLGECTIILEGIKSLLLPLTHWQQSILEIYD